MHLLMSGIWSPDTFIVKTVPVADSASTAMAHACTPPMWFCTRMRFYGRAKQREVMLTGKTCKTLAAIRTLIETTDSSGVRL